MQYSYHFINGTQEVREDLGSAFISPGSGVVVNSIQSFSVTYTAGIIPVGTGGAIRFSIPLPFTGPQLDNPDAEGYATVSCEKKDIVIKLSLNLSAYTGFDEKDGHHGAHGRSVFAGIVQGQLEQGDRLILRYMNARVPEYSAHFEFTVAVDPDGRRVARNSGYSLVANFPRIFIEPQEASHFLLYLPSRLERKNRLTVVARDQYDNYDRHYSGQQVLLPGKNILSFQDGLAQCLYPADRKSVLRVNIGNDVSNPSRRFKKGYLFWGDLHTHSLLYDGIGTPDEIYTYGRDIARLDFQSLSEHNFLDPSVWRYLIEAAVRFNDPGRFVTLAGYEARTADIGDINIYFAGDDAVPPPQSEGRRKVYPLKEYAALLQDTNVVAIPHCHLKPSIEYPVDFYRKMPLVEIYSQWGCFESTGLPFGNGRVSEAQSVINSLKAGLRFGFCAGSDNHSGNPGYGKHGRGGGKTPRGGLTAVYAPSLTRKDLWDALQNRKCYATTGCRMILDFSVNGMEMGSIVNKSPAERIIRAQVNGCGPLKRLVIVRNGVEAQIIPCKGKQDIEIEWIDREALNSLWLPATVFSAEPFIFYYLRVEQEDQEKGWTSPIWFCKAARDE